MIKEHYLLSEDKKTHKKYSKNITTSYLKDENKTKQDYHFSLIKKSIEKEKNLSPKEKHNLLSQLEKTKDRIKREEQEKQSESEKSNKNNSVEDLISGMTNAFNKIASENGNRNKSNQIDPNKTALSNIKNFFYKMISEYKKWKKMYNDKGNFKLFLKKLCSYNGKKINNEGGNGQKQLSVNISEEFLNNIKE